MTVRAVPVIDVSRLPDDAEAVARIGAACRDWGFFQIVGHGVAEAVVAELGARMRDFFALPTAQKHRVLRSDRNVWGFYDRELTKNRRDWKEIFDVGPPEESGPLAGASPQWPSSPPGFQPVVEAFARACEPLSQRLLAAIARSLGASERAFHDAFGPAHTSFLRLNHYPTCDDPAPADAATLPERGRLGIHHHTDAGALTVLMQDGPAGLQVWRDGVWHLVDPVAGAFVVNVGDVVQVWSNDRYAAPVHRVLASSDAPRYSAAWFFNPTYETTYAPLPEVVGSGEPHYRPIRWDEFRAARAAGDYADSGEEIQISHYRLDASG